MITYSLLALFLISFVFIGVMTKKPFDFYLGGLFVALTYLLFYFQSRLLHSMCAGTLIKYQIKEGSKYTGFEKESAISLGGHYRFGDALIISGLLEMAYFGIGLSYDVNLSGLTAATKSRGGVEFSFRYIIPRATVYGTKRM